MKISFCNACIQILTLGVFKDLFSTFSSRLETHNGGGAEGVYHQKSSVMSILGFQ